MSFSIDCNYSLLPFVIEPCDVAQYSDLTYLTILKGVGIVAIQIQRPKDLFYYDLCAMYDIEQKMVRMLPVLAQECIDNQARQAFILHEQDTQQHIRNLEQCFQILGSQPMGIENHAAAGLRRDHDDFLQQRPPGEAVSMFVLHSGYQSECLEIAAYHDLIDKANSLGFQDCVQLFQQNLQQEVNASATLAAIAHQLGQLQARVVHPPSSAPMPNQSSTIGKSSIASQMQQGMQVVGSDMSNVGRVRDILENDFLVDIPLHRDLFVPFSAIQNIDNGRVVLNVPGNQIDDMGWSKAPLV
jgi:ferritin-like metal-binding protein YciE